MEIIRYFCQLHASTQISSKIESRTIEQNFYGFSPLFYLRKYVLLCIWVYKPDDFIAIFNNRKSFNETSKSEKIPSFFTQAFSFSIIPA